MELQDEQTNRGCIAAIAGPAQPHLGRNPVRAGSSDSAQRCGASGDNGKRSIKELLLTISPKSARNLEALEFALNMRQRGATQREISGALYSKGYKRTKAWLIATMAVDLA